MVSLVRHDPPRHANHVRHLHPGCFTGSRPPGSSSNSSKIFSAHPITFLPTPRPRKSFIGNTYGSPRKCCKQKTYDLAKPFSCNTYKKHGGGLVIMVNQVLETSHPSLGAAFKFFVLTLLRTLLHFFALSENSTLLFSSDSALFHKNRGVREGASAL